MAAALSQFTALPGTGFNAISSIMCTKQRKLLKVQAQAMGQQQTIYPHNWAGPVRQVRSKVCTVTHGEAMPSPLVSVAGMDTGIAARISAIEAEIARMKLEVAIQEEIETDDEEIISQQEIESFYEGRRSVESNVDSALKHPYAHLNVSERWEEIQGSQHWSGLLDPIDPVLRGEMLRYGEFAQATYDAFDYDSHSKFCGSCRYSKTRLLSQVGLDNRGYEVTDYLYGTCGDNPLANFFVNQKHELAGRSKDNEKVWDKESNWMGFVAVVTDPEEIARLGRRDIVVVWRGTVTKLEWLENLRDYLAPSGLDQRNSGQGPLNDLKLEAGFLAVYKTKNERSPYTTKSARQQVLEAVKRLVQKYGEEENLSITVTGHSLGSALAKICAYDMAESRINHRTKVHCHKHRVPEHWDDHHGEGSSDSEDDESEPEEDLGDIPITVFSYGGPRVGNDAFRYRVEELGIRVLRVVNENDRVTKLPGVLINEKWQFLEKNLKPVWNWLETLPWTYSHIGIEFKLNNLDSPFLRRTKDPWNAHNLEAYLHLLNGFHGSGLPFSPALPRDIALVNKGTNLLTANHYIPPAWWQQANKGLIREHGRWVVRSRDPQDYPEYHLDDLVDLTSQSQLQ